VKSPGAMRGACTTAISAGKIGPTLDLVGKPLASAVGVCGVSYLAAFATPEPSGQGIIAANTPFNGAEPG